MQEYTSEIARLKGENTSLREQVQMLSQQVETLRNGLREAEKEIEKLTKERSSLAKQVSILGQENVRLKQQIEELKKFPTVLKKVLERSGRMGKIVALLLETREMPIEMLWKALNISPLLVRRELNLLQQLGLVKIVGDKVKLIL